MKTWTLFLAVGLFGIGPAWLYAQAPESEPMLLLPGEEYTEEEIPDRAEGAWWVVEALGDTFHLSLKEVRVEHFQDLCIDETPDDKSGRRMIVDGAASLFLLRGVDGLHAGPLEADFWDQRVGFQTDTLTVPFNDHTFQLRRVPHDEGFAVEWVDGDDVQRLYEAPWQDDGGWSLRWVGDVNRDGYPDVLLDASHKYSIMATRLYLSALHAPGWHLQEIALSRRTAC